MTRKTRKCDEKLNEHAAAIAELVEKEKQREKVEFNELREKEFELISKGHQVVQKYFFSGDYDFNVFWALDKYYDEYNRRGIEVTRGYQKPDERTVEVKSEHFSPAQLRRVGFFSQTFVVVFGIICLTVGILLAVLA